MKKRKESRSNIEFKFKDLIIRCLFFSILFFVVGLLICFILSYFAYKTKDPTSLLKICGIASLFLSVLITSFIQSKINKQHYLLGGILLGAFILVLTVLFSTIFLDDNLTNDTILIKLLIPAFSVLGSMMGIKKTKRHNQRR